MTKYDEEDLEVLTELEDAKHGTENRYHIWDSKDLEWCWLVRGHAPLHIASGPAPLGFADCSQFRYEIKRLVLDTIRLAARWVDRKLEWM